MGAPKLQAKKYPRGAIVPSRCRPRKSKRSKTIAGVIPTPVPDTCCGPGPVRPGFQVCFADGSCGLMNDWPATGGPWVPAVNPVTGGFVWVNSGG